MNRLIPGVIVFLFVVPAFATISKVQSNAKWTCSGTSCAQPFTASNPVTHNLIAVWTIWQSTGTVTASAGDNLLCAGQPCNTYLSAVGPTLQPNASTPTTAQVFYAKNYQNPGMSPVTVTVTFSGTGTVTSAGVVIVEYSGLDTVTPLDSVSQAISSAVGPSLDSGTTAPANANVLVFGAGNVDINTTFAYGGFTNVQSNSVAGGSSLTEQLVVTGNTALQRATVCAGTLSPCSTNTGGNWLMQMAVFRAASWTVSSGWSTTQTPQVANAAQYPGSDPCVQAQNAEINNNGANIMLPIFGGGLGSQTPCSVDPLGGFSGNGGVLKLTNTGNGNSAVLAISGPVHLGGASLIAEDQRVSDMGGVSLGASATFAAAAAKGIFKNTGTCGGSACSIVITPLTTSCGGSLTTCGCYDVAYNDPGYQNIVRGTRPGIQFFGFGGTGTPTGTSMLNNIPRRALAGNGSSSNWGDAFCTQSGANYAQGPTTNGTTAHFEIFAPDAYAAGFVGCGGSNATCGSAAQITNWTPMAWQGAAETDTALC